MSHPFDYQPRTRIIHESGSLARLGELAKGLGAQRVLLVTDTHIVEAGHTPRGEESLRAAGLEVFRFEDVHENPTTEDVRHCVAFGEKHKIDLIIGLGGGSCLDTAKGCNFLLTNGGHMEDYWGYGKAEKPLLPFIAVPTTAGTGSECQSYALIAREDNHMKMACGDPTAAPAIALLDAELTITMPRQVTVATGLDALVHSVECAVTKRRTPISLMFAREAFKLLIGNFARVLSQPNDLEARAAMQLGAAYAGVAIENSMLGAAHSAANPLSAHYDVVHGQGVATMLPLVTAFNGQDPSVRELYKALAVHGELASLDDSSEQALDKLLAQLNQVLELAQFSESLAQQGLNEKDIPTLAKEAEGQWTAQFNPREIKAADFEQLYRQALIGRKSAAAS